MKLLGVTLVFSAAFIGNSSHESNSGFAYNEVREIILDQIQNLGANKLPEVIEWDIAVNVKTPESNNAFAFAYSNGKSPFYIEVIPFGKVKLDFTNAYLCELSFYSEYTTYNPYLTYTPFIENNLYVLDNNPSRAGPYSVLS